jgi:hypothetical protein
MGHEPSPALRCRSSQAPRHPGSCRDFVATASTYRHPVATIRRVPPATFADRLPPLEEHCFPSVHLAGSVRAALALYENAPFLNRLLIEAARQSVFLILMCLDAASAAGA